jgi:hypothetical protein
VIDIDQTNIWQAEKAKDQDDRLIKQFIQGFKSMQPLKQVIKSDVDNTVDNCWVKDQFQCSLIHFLFFAEEILKE